MIIYSKTFCKSISQYDYLLPKEDAYFCIDNLICMADGVSRDPLGISTFEGISDKEFVDRYPKNGKVAKVAQIVCETLEESIDIIKENKTTLKDILIKANSTIKDFNDIEIKRCDYLQNDYYATAAAIAYINSNVLNYAYIADCGIIIYDKIGNVKFKTIDSMEHIDKYCEHLNFNWYNENDRVEFRKNYRNNINNPLSFGALTGEKAAEEYIKAGKINLDEGDIIVTYSDGFSSIVLRNDFFEKVLYLFEKNNEKFEDAIFEIEKEAPGLYRKEKTIVVYVNK